jgi:hypothetical protein
VGEGDLGDEVLSEVCDSDANRHKVSTSQGEARELHATSRLASRQAEHAGRPKAWHESKLQLLDRRTAHEGTRSLTASAAWMQAQHSMDAGTAQHGCRHSTAWMQAQHSMDAGTAQHGCRHSTAWMHAQRSMDAGTVQHGCRHSTAWMQAQHEAQARQAA